MKPGGAQVTPASEGRSTSRVLGRPTRPPEAASSAFLRMVASMRPNRDEHREVSDWLAGRGGAVFAVIAVAIVVWGVFVTVTS